MAGTAFSFYSSKAFGGGHTNVIEVAKQDENYVLVGTDVSGLFISSDGGKTFRPKNSYIGAIGAVDARCVAAVAINPNWSLYPGHMYALVGEGTANTGNLVFSTDYGETWSRSVTTPAANSTPVGHGNNTTGTDLLPTPQPRSTGTLIQVDTVNGVLYVASYKWGLYRVALANLAAGTTTWERIGFTNGYGGGFPATQYFIRSIMFGAEDPDVLYVADHTGLTGGNGHVWRCTNPRTNLGVSGAGLTWEEFTDSSGVNFEELVAADTALFGMMSTPGNRVRRLALSKTCAVGTVWTDIEAPGTTVPIAPTAPTVVASATAGNPNGTYQCAVSFEDATGEFGIGLIGTVSPVSKKIDWSAIPVGPAGTLKRHLYRTKAGGGAKGQTDFFRVTAADATLADNVTTAFAGDNVSDSSLGNAQNPVSALHSIDSWRTGGVMYLAVSTIDQDNKAPIWEAESSDVFATQGTATWKNVTPAPGTLTVNDLSGPNVPAIPFAGWTFTPTVGGVNKYMMRNQGPGGRPWISRKNRKNLWTGGRVFHTANGDLPAAGQLWYPYLNGIVQFAGRYIAADPTVSQRFYEAVLDGSFIRYTDRGNTPVQDKPGVVSGANDGISVCVDPVASPTVVYVAFGDANNNNKSEIWRLTNPWNDGGSGYQWDLVKDNATSMGADSDKLVTGMIVVRIAGTKYLLAHVRNGGVYKATIGAAPYTWTKMTSAVPATGGAAEDLAVPTSGSGPNHAIFSSLLDSTFVYVHSRGSGVWRVNGIAGTWTRIYRNNTSGNSAEGSGHVSVRPGDNTKVYVSRAGGLIVRLDLASTCIEDAATVVTVCTAIANPGPLIVRADKKIYCVSHLGNPTKFMEADATTPGSGEGNGTDGQWTDVSTVFVRDICFMPYVMAAAPDGSLYTSLRGNNMIVAQAPSVIVTHQAPYQDLSLSLGLGIGA